MRYEYKSVWFSRPEGAISKRWDKEEPEGWREVWNEVSIEGAYVVFRRTRKPVDSSVIS